MKKEIVPHEQSLALKELGFDEPCMLVYDSEEKVLVHCLINNIKNNVLVDYTIGLNHREDIKAPTFSQAFRWFRENKSYSCSIEYDNETNNYQYKYVYMSNGYVFSKKYETYEEAELECLKKLIEIIKDK